MRVAALTFVTFCLLFSCEEDGNQAEIGVDGGPRPDASPELDASSGEDVGPEGASPYDSGTADCATCNPEPPDMYEPFEHVAPELAERSASELSQSNGCFSRPFGAFHDREMCVATTRPVTDLTSETTPSRARAGKSSMRFVLRPTPEDDWPAGEPTHRNELAPDGAWDYFPSVGQERWYGFSVLFPEDFVFAPAAIASSNRFIISQWQHGTAGSPAVSLEVLGDGIQVVVNGGTAPDAIQETRRETIASIVRGQWLDFVVQIVWHKSNGRVAVWSQGHPVFEAPSLQTVYDNKENGGKMKVGIYYWRWKNLSDVKAALAAGIVQRELFLDELREFAGSDGYAIVAPRS